MKHGAGLVEHVPKYFGRGRGTKDFSGYSIYPKARFSQFKSSLVRFGFRGGTKGPTLVDIIIYAKIIYAKPSRRSHDPIPKKNQSPYQQAAAPEKLAPGFTLFVLRFPGS